MVFKGVFTAIITPFNTDGSLDEDSLRRLVKHQLDGGISGIVPCGTTGEAPTLSNDEWEKVVSIVVEEVNGKVPVIAGTGTNSTAKTIANTKRAKELGADAALVVNPYYNKPTQKGLYLHFSSIANEIDIPIVLYNIKGRTGVNVETETLVKLTNECPNIVAVKEASGDIKQIKEVIEKTHEDFIVLAGDDGITLDLIKEGGHGVISVLSNVMPKEMEEMAQAALKGDFDNAKELNDNLEDLFEVEFIETNPIPIKFMASKLSLCKEAYRLPMCELEDSSKSEVEKVMKEKKLI